MATYETEYGLEDIVYINDRFDTKNQCSAMQHSKREDLISKSRICFVTGIIIQRGVYLYYVQPEHLTDYEKEHGECSFYWEKGFTEKELERRFEIGS